MINKVLEQGKRMIKVDTYSNTVDSYQVQLFIEGHFNANGLGALEILKQVFYDDFSFYELVELEAIDNPSKGEEALIALMKANDFTEMHIVFTS
jgi:hypothetical protein